MSRGSKVVVAYAPQTNVSVIPAVGWKVLPYKSFGVNANYEMLQSETIVDSRLAQKGMVNKGTVAGDVEVEVANKIYDDLIAGAAFNQWDNDVLNFGGNTQLFFALQRAYKDIGVVDYFGGNLVNTFELSVTAGQYATMKFGFVGSDYQSKDDGTEYVTALTADNTVIERATKANIEDVKLNGVTTRGTACITDFNIQFNNNIQGVDCFGGGLFDEAQLELGLDATGSFNLQFSKQARQIVANQVTGNTVSLELTIKFTSGAKYILNIPAMQVTGEAPSGGRNDLLAQTVNFTAVEQAVTLTRVPAAI